MKSILLRFVILCLVCIVGTTPMQAASQNQEKRSDVDLKVRSAWIEESHQDLSLRAQCILIGLPRANYYYRGIPEGAFNLVLMKRIDEIYTDRPCNGSRVITQKLRREGALLRKYFLPQR